MVDRLAATSPGGDLRLRVLSAAVLVPVAVAAEIAGGLVFAALVAVVAVLGMIEWSAITAGGEPGWLRYLVMVLLVVVLALVTTSTPRLALGVTALAGAAIVAAGRVRAGAFWLAGGLVYLAVPAIALIALRGAEPFGWAAILFVFVVVWTTDTAAYFAGRRFGGPKLWPRLSPKKTWSGALGGLAAAVIAGGIVAAATGTGGVVRAALAAGLLSVAAQAGDLFESAVKRRFGVKDSGRIIPGHGGILDRMDGVFAAAMIAACVALAGLGGALLAWPPASVVPAPAAAGSLEGSSP